MNQNATSATDIVEIDGEQVEVSILFVPPCRGEAGWYADPDSSAEDVLRDVIVERERADPASAPWGLGWVAWENMPAIDSDGDRVVTIHARKVAS